MVHREEQEYGKLIAPKKKKKILTLDKQMNFTPMPK